MPFGRVSESFVKEPFLISCFTPDRQGPGRARRLGKCGFMFASCSGGQRPTERTGPGQSEHPLPSPLWEGGEGQERVDQPGEPECGGQE